MSVSILELLEEAHDLYKHHDEERRRLMSEAMEAGVSADKIASTLGLASSGTVRSLVTKYREGESIGHHSVKANA
jgi:transposase-like protein